MSANPHRGAKSALAAARPAMSPSEQVVASWIQANPDTLLRASMAEVALACGVSDTTVLRTCRTAGFVGFTELKLALAQDLASPTELIHAEVSEGDDEATIASKVFGAVITSLRDTLAHLRPDQLVSAIDLLAQAGRVVVGGVGTSGLVAQSFYQRCIRVGLNIHAPADPHLQIMQAALLGPGDLVLVISQSGTTLDAVQVLEAAREVGAATMAITGNAMSPVGLAADVVLLSVSHETRGEPLAARACQLTILDALYVGLASRDVGETLRRERIIEGAISGRSY